MSNHQAAGVEEGDVLAGKYRIDKVLGVGGVGVVVAAHHIQLDDKVAIKFLLPEALANRDAVARFAREARAAVKIKGEHVARVIDVGQLENGSPYIVMEYLDGSDLSQWVERGGALPFEQAVEFVLQACEAIAEAHALGIVHRDLKPANLFVTKRPDTTLSVKVLDFGISKSTLKGGASGMTRTFAMMGSPLYMSPEQIQSAKDVDLRTDVWALGVILYELTTGQAPFTGETLAELVYQIMSQPAPALKNTRPDATDEFEQIIAKCLAKERAERYQSIAELALALEEFANERAKSSIERIVAILAAGKPQLRSVSDALSEPPAWLRSTTGGPRTRIALFAIGGLLLVALAAFFLLRPSATKPPSAGREANSSTAPAARAVESSVKSKPTSPIVEAVPPTPAAKPATAAVAPTPPRTRPATKLEPHVPAKLSPPSAPARATTRTPEPAPAQRPPPRTESPHSWGGRL